MTVDCLNDAAAVIDITNESGEEIMLEGKDSWNTGKVGRTVRPWDARFLGKEKTRAAQIFVQLLLLNRVKARWSETVLLTS